MARSRQALLASGHAVAMLTIGGLSLVFALVYLLRDEAVIPDWSAWMIFAALTLAASGALGYLARSLFESFNPLPDNTFTALQENLTGKTEPQPQA